MIKATFRYNAHRKGKDGENITRPSFGWENEIDKLTAYELIDMAEKGTVFFRFKISPDPKKENPKGELDLYDLTRKVMAKIEELKDQHIQFIGVKHDDHTKIPHIHAIVLLKGRIDTKDLKTLIETATQAALTQRQERDRFQTNQRHRQASILRMGQPTERGVGGIRTYQASACPQCGYARGMKILSDTVSWCSLCGYILDRNPNLTLASREVSWSR